MGRPSRFSPEVRERAIRRVMEQRPAHPSEWAALQAVATKLGMTAETLRKWVRQAERDTGQRPGLTTSERERLAALERENRGPRAPERPAEPPFSRRPRRRPEPEEPAEPEVVPRTPSLEDLLAEITARGRARGHSGAEEIPWVEPPARRTGFPLAGCLVRVVGLVFLLIAAVIIFLFLFFGSLMMD